MLPDFNLYLILLMIKTWANATEEKIQSKPKMVT